MFIVLAHGVFGIWDELIPVVLVGAFILILVGAGLMARREEAKLEKQASAEPAEQTAQQNSTQADFLEADNTAPVTQPSTAADHYRLD